ncbi:MAG: methyltransferase [Bdellovibrionota bacterium]
MSSSPTLSCHNFSSGRCGSCPRLALPEEDRFSAKFSSLKATIHERFGPNVEVLPPYIPEQIFPSRTKAKMSVTGSLVAPCIGILDENLQGRELLDCPLHLPVMNEALKLVRDWIPELRLVPYDIETRRGELKGLVLRASADAGSLIIRFVLRSTESVPRLKKGAPLLMTALPQICTLTANIQPVPHAIVEGREEIVIAGSGVLWERYGEIELAFTPQSFSQVTPQTALALYTYVADATAEQKPKLLLDLYCGVGGFSLFAGRHAEKVIGVELAESAVDCARLAAERNGRSGYEFVAAPVDSFLADKSFTPDAVICNPPRRGLRAEVTSQLERLGPARILYSSCNPDTLFEDIALLPSYRPRRFKPFEMFPLTEHVELVCDLVRR